jgi:prolyl-tRNA synthetase
VQESERLHLPLGFLGPVDLPPGIALYADPEVAEGGPWVVGANVEGYHLNNVWGGRDFVPDRVLPLRRAQAGDRCPQCGGRLSAQRGIEVGHVFRLGTKYSCVLGANFLDQEGQTRPMTMGCYGIGVTRTVAAVIEQHHDRDGIIWPASVAPYHAVLLPVGTGSFGSRAQQVAEELSVQLAKRGISAVIDDRDERPGVKFKDADLLGFPVRITLGKALEHESAELRLRKDGIVQMVPLTAVADVVSAQIQEATAVPIA